MYFFNCGFEFETCWKLRIAYFEIVLFITSFIIYGMFNYFKHKKSIKNKKNIGEYQLNYYKL
jgi:uncharacterized membrane protein